jgi:hypothetical protein
MGTGKAFIDGIRERGIKQQLLLGSERTVNVALKQTLELEAVKLGASPLPNGRRDYLQIKCRCSKSTSQF